MGKGHYLGGGTLLGCGSVSKAKSGGKGGLGSGAALREQRRQAARKKRQETAAKIKENEKLLSRIGKDLTAAKGRAHYERLVTTQRAKISPLAEALQRAFNAADAKGRPT